MKCFSFLTVSACCGVLWTCCLQGVESFSTTYSITSRHQQQQQRRVSSTQRFLADKDDAAEYASPLKLSSHDLQRLTRLQESRVQMPILILEAMLPKQQLTFESQDPKFHKLVQHCLETGSPLGMLGMNPHTGRPLCRGVTVDLCNSPAVANPVSKSVRVAVTGQERMEVQGEPRLDASGSFYVADVEIVNDRYEALSDQQQADAETLAKTLPDLMQKWTKWVVKSGATDKQGLQERLEAVGTDMPEDLTERALWVAAMLNPVPALDKKVCLEIRPAMLACTNDYDRTVLAVQALQSSIDHLSGKHKLF